MIKAIAIDDEPPALKVLEKLCAKQGGMELLASFTSPVKAKEWLADNPVELIFLDIQMPTINGVDFYKSLQNPPMVVFTTAFSNFAVEGFNVSAMDYLLKPISFERFDKAIIKVGQQLALLKNATTQPMGQITIKADYTYYKIQTDHIQYIEALDDYVRIHIDNQKAVVAKMTMKSMMELLPGSDFVRPHRSFILPISRITTVRNKTIVLPNKEIPIGIRYEEAFMERFIGG